MAFVKDILNGMTQTIADDGEDKKKQYKPKLKSTLWGGLAGGLVGLMVGYSKKWNLFYSMVGGAALGGLIANLSTPDSK
jgi:uncharacterized membrane protein YebE (DUF533 family)